MKLLYANIKKLDVSSLGNCSVVGSVKEIKDTNNEGAIYILPVTKLESGLPENAKVYMPFNSAILRNGWRVYFDLESYSFYQKAKEVIEKGKASKGVFRYRRIIRNDYESLVIGDLFVLFSLFGEPRDIQVKITDQTLTPAHTILTLNFGEGTLAHVEFTVGADDRIELEWSGINTILEFDSDQTRSIQPDGASLRYSINSILEKSHRVNLELITRLNKINELLGGGDHS
ncbi:hypothetical protein [Sporosarcina jiandibaonis]|uniref:hypothetical protein n=1 Tax=Sporosarcina jiandibaonis TaxID=2715535 RepID=UPI001552D480|nr:hypothetical protein [Sporosarcina jiandibaonis]